MKTINLLFAMAAVAILNCKAQTTVPAGNVSGTWTLAGSPYNVMGSIQIADANTLTIQPGVTVNFQGHYKFNVQGRLLAFGTATDTIVFTSANTTNGWWGIRFDNTPATNDTSKIVYCKLQYGRATGSSPNTYGGALFFNNFSKAIISNSHISHCTALDYGAGIACNGSSPIIRFNIISNNTTIYDGGGIACLASNSVITNNIIFNNSADNGGGIYCNSGSPTIIDNNISNNTASGIIGPGPGNGFGGGIYFQSTSPIVTNNIISNNSATKGGGLFCADGSATINNNTISNNSASSNGGALYCFGASVPTFRNSILFGNTATTSGTQVFLNDEACDPKFFYCDVQGGSAAFELNGNFYTGIYQNNIDADPLFTSPSGGSGNGYNGSIVDWALQSSSSCINSGDPTTNTPSFDILGQPRIVNCRIDLGAYEYQSGSSISVTIAQTSPIICFGNTTGALQATPSGPGSPFTYLWSPGGATTSSISNLGVGTYNVLATNSNGCVTFATFLITQQNTMSLQTSQTALSCGGQCNASAIVTALNGTAPFSYLWSTNPPQNSSATSATLCIGTYSVTVTDNTGCAQIASVNIITQPNAMTLQTSQTNPFCNGQCAGSAIVTALNGIAPLAYSWSTIPPQNSSATSATLCIGTYSVTVTDSIGCTLIANVTIGAQSEFSLIPSITNASCHNSDGGISIIPTGDTAISNSYSYLWINGSTNQNLSGVGGGAYSVSVTNNIGCVISDTFTVNTIAPNPIPICMVTVDSTSTKNVIVWEKPFNISVDSFRIYREIASVYNLIGSVPFNSLSEFTDNANGINPNTTSYKYELSVLDSCGVESILSSDHQTIHLQLSPAIPQGVNLSWNDYIGFSFSQYRILRDNTGNGDWQAIDSVSYGITTYTSSDVLPNGRYMVEAKNPIQCISTRQNGNTRSSSKSNTASQTTGLSDLASNQLAVNISPNPTNGKFTIVANSSRFTNNKCEVKIYDVLGERIYLSELKLQTSNEIDLSNAPTGIYFLNVYNGDEIYTKRIVKQ